MVDKRIKRFSLISILLAVTLIFTGCFGNTNEGSSGNSETLNLLESAEPPGMDISKSTDQVSFTILSNVMEGLYFKDQKDMPVLGMASEEPKVSEDKKTYTFTLRDANWSDGKPVTAHDFVYSYKRTLDPKTASEYAYILFYLKNAEQHYKGKTGWENVGVKALDDKTLELKLEYPTPFFRELLAFALYLPQRQDIVEKHKGKYAMEAENLVYNGPYTLNDWQHGKSFQYKKNDKYWDKDTIKLNHINVSVVKDAGTAVNLYKTGKVDAIGLNSDYLNEFKGSPELRNVSDASSWYFEFNQTKALFKNKKIRKAVSLAVNRELMTKEVFKDGSVPASSIVPEGIHTTDGKGFRSLSTNALLFNPTQAKKLWLQGLQETGLSSNPRVTFLTGDSTTARRDAEFIKEQLRKNLGLNVEIVNVTFKQRLVKMKRGEFDIVFAGWGADYNDPISYLDLWQSDNTQNNGKWKNARYDQLIDQAQLINDQAERTKLLVEAEQILSEEVGVAVLYHRRNNQLVKPYVKGWNTPLIGASYLLRYISLEGKK